MSLIRNIAKGTLGELSVNVLLAGLGQDYIIMDNLMLSNNGYTTQIDHVVISIYGIFVIETKNYKGIITGGEFAETWTQHLYTESHPMPNPIRQNYGHIQAIRRKISGVYTGEIYSIIAFSSDADVKVNVSSAAIIHIDDIRSEILRHSTQMITKEQMQQVFQLLNRGNVDGLAERFIHVGQVNDHVRSRQQLITGRVCPQCGGELKLKQGPYGNFYGCSNYPRCKYTSKG